MCLDCVFNLTKFCYGVRLPSLISLMSNLTGFVLQSIIYYIISRNPSVCMYVCMYVRKLLLDRSGNFLHIWRKHASHTGG